MSRFNRDLSRGTLMASTSAKVLVIEDDRLIRHLLSASLPSRGFTVIEAETGAAGLDTLDSEPVDLIILDLSLPDIPGLRLLRQICCFNIPIVILSHTTSVTTIVEALDEGASDYITKPFSVDELTARLRVALRDRPEVAVPVFHNGELTIDLANRRIRRGRTNIKVSPTEFAILKLLVIHAGKVLTHDQILGEIWNHNRNIDCLRVYIAQLRKRIEIDPYAPRYIMTYPGVGYLLLSE
jgi:two-component system, OmpR family, KDP operon response regulator KdpE